MTGASRLRETSPALRCLSLGAGVQSSTVLLLACEGVIPTFDHALFADTGWEPKAVYENLARLRRHAAKFGIPVHTVSAGNIRADALDPAHRFVSMPLHVLNPDGSRGLARRQCTAEYKIAPLKKAVRELLGYPHPRRVPRGVYAEQAIGISTDEFARAKDSDVQYLRNVFPLIDLCWDRTRCTEYLAERGFGNTVKSACLGCPFHGNAGWRWIRDNDPDGWTDAVAFDHAIRHGYPHATSQGQELRGQYFLHRSCQPLDQVDLDPPVPAKRHLRLVNTPTAAADEDDEPDGCSPWACRSGTSATEKRAA
jgi:3'-phosphoadenosine 5'-phosphosulfate sulfotransferase (PAPS reductase)/FAD synthetase